MKLSQCGEFELIRRLSSSLKSKSHVIKGIGDDAAVLSRDPSTYSLLACDALVEKVHFTSKHPPQWIGRKLMAVNLSDIAAMGGIPESAVVTLGVPSSCDLKLVERVYAGMEQLARKYGVAIVGGDTVRTPRGLFLDLTLTGRVEKKCCLFRKGARAGDLLFVTGRLGGTLKKRQFLFEPRLKEGRFLAQTGLVNAMIDISDGLAGDVAHLARESKTGARIDTNRLPVSKSVSGRSKKEKIQKALTDGEDYELLMAVPQNRASRLIEQFSKRKNFPKLTCVGEIVPASKGIMFLYDGKPLKLRSYGYKHF